VGAAAKKLLITGATGMLGKHVAATLAHAGAYMLYTCSRSVLPPGDLKSVHEMVDISDRAATLAMLDRIKPEVIVHCAAVTDVNLCERERDYVHAMHVGATETLCRYPSVERFVYISTDSVFDGQRGNYTENDAVNPLNYYAKTKLMGEDVVHEHGGDYLVLRTNILGFQQPLRNSLFEWGYKSLLQGQTINGFSNVYFNALYCGDVAAIIKAALPGLASGTYHIGGIGSISKYDFLRAIAEYFKFGAERVNPVLLDVTKFEALRPLNTVLSLDKIRSAGISLPSIPDTLDHLFADFSKQQIV